MRRTSKPAAWLFALVCSAGVLAPALAAAQTAGCESEAHRRGRALRAQGLHEQAYEHFRALYAREQSGCSLARMGQALHALQRWAEAERALAQVLARADDPWVTQLRGPLEQELGEVRAHLAELTVTLARDVPGAELWIGAERLGALPLAHGVWLAAGTAAFEVRAPGYASEARTVRLREGGSHHETVVLLRAEVPQAVVAALSSAPPTRAPVTASVAPSGQRLLVPAVAAFGVAGALAIGGGVLVGVALQRYDEYLACATDALGAETLCPQRRGDANGLLRLGYGGFGLAGAAAATGVVLLVVGAPRAERAPRVGALCVPSLATLGLECLGRF